MLQKPLPSVVVRALASLVCVAALALTGCGGTAAAQPPAAPTGLSATAAGNTITLAWSASLGASSYQVLRSASSGTGYAQIGTATGASYTDSGLAPATTFFYVVRAVNAAGASGNSAEASGTTSAPQPPAPPAGLTAHGGIKQVTLSWTASAGATGYQVLRGPQGGGATTAVGTSSTAGFTDTGLTDATTYVYAVKSVSAVGAGAATDPVSATTTPAAPTGVQTVGGAGQVVLSWTASAGAAGYKVLRGAAAGQATTPVGTPAASPFTDSGLPPGTTYFYVVAATNGSGDGAPSAEVSALTAPDAPAGLSVAPALRQVVLAWTAATTATSYTVQRSTQSGTGYAPVATGLTATTFTNTGLADGTAYYYEVLALNASGAGSASAEVSAVTAPPAPTGLSATARPRQLSLSWAASATATSYNLLRSTASGSGYAALATGVVITNYTDTSVNDATVYYYQVQAVNAAGAGLASPEYAALTVPAAPAGLGATGGSKLVMLAWTASTGAASYTVLRSAQSGTGYAAIAAAVTSTTYQDGALADGATWFYEVAAANASGASTPSNEASATTVPPPPTNLTAQKGDQSVKLSWTAAQGATSYDLLYSTTQGSYATSTPVSSTTSPATITGLTNNQLYYFVARARNAAGASGNSNEAVALPSFAPSPPVLNTATGGNAQVVLAWTPGAGGRTPTGFTVFRADAVSAPFVSLLGSPLPASAVTYTDTTVVNNHTYYYEVVATQSAGNSDPSSVLSATPRAPLAPPTNIVAFGGNGQVKLSWTPDPSGISVNVLRGAVPGGPYPIAVASNATSTSVVDNVGITNGTLYYYVLQSVGATSTSGDSVEVSAHAQRELCVATPDYAAYSFDADAPSGFVLPNRVFGDQTRVVTPLDVAYDPVHAELWETDQVGSVVAFSSTADGNAAPLRIIGGAIAHLGIGIAGGLAVDPALGEVYVGAIYEIVTFSRTAHGQVAPLRSFTPFASTAISGVVGLSYDATNHELWTIDTSNATVKGFSRTAAGTPASPATPLRSITNQGIYGYSDGWAPAGVLVDPAHDELLVVYGNAVATSPALFVVYDRYLYGTDGRNDQPIKRWFVVPAVTGANPQPALITDLGLALAYDPAADEYIVATGSSVSALLRTSGLQPSNPMVPFPDAAGTGQPPAPDTTGPYAGSTNYPTAARSRPYLGGTGTFGAHIGSGNAVAVDVANRLVFTAGTPRLQTGGLATFQLAGGSAIRRIIGTQSGSQFGFLGIDLVNGELWSGWEYPTGISAWSLGAASVPTPARTLVAAEITSDRAGVLGIAFNEAAGELYASSGWGIAPAGAEPPQVLTYLRTSSGTTSAVGTPITTTAGSALFFDPANQELWVANGPGCTANVANCAPPASTTPPQLSAYSRTPAGVGNFSSTPLRTIISAGIGAPGAITVAGNSVFVTNSTNGHVLSFSRTGTGTLSPATEIIQKPAACNPFVTRGLHVDAQGNLFVADLGPGNSTCIAVYHSSDSGPAVVPQRELQLIGASQPQSLAPCN